MAEKLPDIEVDRKAFNATLAKLIASPPVPKKDVSRKIKARPRTVPRSRSLLQK